MRPIYDLCIFSYVKTGEYSHFVRSFFAPSSLFVRSKAGTTRSDVVDLR